MRKSPRFYKLDRTSANYPLTGGGKVEASNERVDHNLGAFGRSCDSLRTKQKGGA
jgi:hypothetical protein